MGCSPLLALAVAHPEVVRGMVLYWPVGGARFRIRGHRRFGRHLAFVQEHGLGGVVELARSHEEGFGEDPRIGPWGPVVRHDDAFADLYRSLDAEPYAVTVLGMVRSLFDRDTSPGAEPEDLLRLETPTLIVPGQDASHATSAARYLQECLPNAEYWDVPVSEQTEATAPTRVVEFLGSVE